MKNLYFFFILISASLASLKAQAPKESLITSLKEYHSIPKEVAYLHLNKTVLLQGEQLGLSAYVVNKNDLKPSLSTTNLYVQIKSEAGELVKEKLLLVENGVASNVIDIDTAFTSGNYRITAFTNWMRNFEEQNYFTENFQVVGSNLDHAGKKEMAGEIDAQFLPESGHLLSEVINVVGVVLKDKMGYGIPDATVEIRDGSNEVVSRTSLNQFGIGKLTLVPDPGERYAATVFYQGKEVPVKFETPVAPVGIIISAVQREKELRLLISTNSASLQKIRDKPFFLLVQNRGLIEAHEFKFGDHKSIPVLFDLSYLQPGMNIITLVDENNQPIAERLFFNYEGLPVRDMQEPTVSSVKDSLEVKFPAEELKETQLSISILPKNSISYNRNHNIISYIMLQPYIRGTVEDGSWYFKDVTIEKKFELDNLLITQGWSSYNWNSFFMTEVKLPHPFEEGVVVKGLIDSKESKKNDLRYLLHATTNNDPVFMEIPSGKEAFTVDGLVPLEGEQLFISRIKKNDKLIPAGLSVQFFPSAIPDFEPASNTLFLKPLSGPEISNLVPIRPFEGPAEELKEVLIETTVDREKERRRKLEQHKPFVQVRVVSEEDIALYGTLENFLKAHNVWIDFKPVVEELTSQDPRSSSGDNQPNSDDSQSNSDDSQSSMRRLGLKRGFTVFLDGIPFSDKSYFYRFPLASIDYIEIDKDGMGNGFHGASIKIFSDLKVKPSSINDPTRIQQFDIPLVYSSQKEFYVPKYENKNDAFFESYGVIDWKPGLSSLSGEEIIFRIKKPEVDFQMIIEGFTADGRFLFDVKTFPAIK